MKNQNSIKRILVCLLTAVMLLGQIPASALADENGQSATHETSSSSTVDPAGDATSLSAPTDPQPDGTSNSSSQSEDEEEDDATGSSSSTSDVKDEPASKTEEGGEPADAKSPSEEEADTKELAPAKKANEKSDEKPDEKTEEAAKSPEDAKDGQKSDDKEDAAKNEAKRGPAQNCDGSTSSAPHFDIVWLDGLHTSEVSADRYSLVDTPIEDTSSATDHYVSAQIHFSIGRSSAPIPAGELKIKLPKYLFTEWDWDGDGVQKPHIPGQKNLADPSKANPNSLPNIGVTKKPTTNPKNFWWYEGEGEDADYIFIENSSDINNINNSPIDFTCMVNYAFNPSAVDETKTYTLKADFPAQIDGQCPSAIANDSLTAKIETGSELYSVSKTALSETSQYKRWPDGWGEEPDEVKDKNYYYVPYKIKATVVGEPKEVDETGKVLSRYAITQPFMLSLSDDPGKDLSASILGTGAEHARVVAVTKWNSTDTRPSSEGSIVYPTYSEAADNYADDGNRNWKYSEMEESDNPALKTTYISPATGPIFNDKGYFTKYDSGNYIGETSADYYTWVLVAYDDPEGIPDEDKEQFTNEATVYKVPYSKRDDREKKTDDANTRKFTAKFHYEGDLFGIDKFSDDTVKNAIFSLNNGMDAMLYEFTLNVTARGYALTQTVLDGYDDTSSYNGGRRIVYTDNLEDYEANPYTVEVMDNQIYLEGELLRPGDYEIVSTTYDSSFYGHSIDPETLKPVLDTDLTENADLYYRTSETGNWILHASDLPEGTTVTDLPSSAIQTKWSFTTTHYSIYPKIRMVIKLRPTDHVLDLIDGKDEATATNVASLAVRDHLGRIWNDAGEQSIADGPYRDLIMQHDQKPGAHPGLQSDRYLQHDSCDHLLTDFASNTEFTKSESQSSDNRDAQISERTYKLQSFQRMWAETDNPQELLAQMEQAGLSHGQKAVTFYDLLPEGAQFNKMDITGSYSEHYYYTNGSSSGRNATAVIHYDEILTINDYQGTGRTMVVIPVSLPEDAPDDFGAYYDTARNRTTLQMSTDVTIKLPVTYSWDTIAMFADTDPTSLKRSYINYAAVESPGTKDGTPDDATVDNEEAGTSLIDADYKEVMSNLHRADGGTSTGNDTYYGRAVTSFNIATSSLTGYTKTVKSDIETTFRTNSAAVSSGEYTYQLRYAVEEGSQAKEIMIYDVLEDAFIDDDYMAVDEFREKYENSGNRYWRGTFDRVDTSMVERLGAAVTVYYSTKPRDVMQRGLNVDASGGQEGQIHDEAIANLQNTEYWTTTMPADKGSITAVAFDVSKKPDGSDFILSAGKDGNPIALLIHVYMKAPDADEVMNGRTSPKHLLPDGSYDTPAEDNPSDYMDPIVYAYNNSYLSIRTKSAASQTWGGTGARMSDGTTVRIAEPRPPIYKQVVDNDETAGGTDEESVAQNPDTDKLDTRDEEFTYTITTRVPTPGNNVLGQVEKADYRVRDELESVLEFVGTRDTGMKVEIGTPSSDAYFVFDPEGDYDGHKGMYRIWHGEYVDDSSQEKVYEEEYFDSLSRLTGFEVKYGREGNDSDSTYNRLSFGLLYDAANETYNRVDDFAGERLTIEFKAKIRDGANIGRYADRRIPNKATYQFGNKPSESSNVVYVQPPEEPNQPPRKTITVDGATQPQRFYVVTKNADGTVSNVPDADGSPMEVTVDDSTGTRVIYDKNDEPYTLQPGQEIKTQQQLDNEQQTAHYTVSGIIPADAVSFSIRDTVENVLEIDEESIKVTFKGTAWEGTDKEFAIDKTLTKKELEFLVSNLSSYDYGMRYEKNGQTISLRFAEAFFNRYGDFVVSPDTVVETDPETGEITRMTEGSGQRGTRNTRGERDFYVAGFEVILEFDAKIKEGADLSPYATELGYEVPNTAKYSFDDINEEDTETVTITPPPEEIFKRVNGKMHEDLLTSSEVFTYTINTLIPQSPFDNNGTPEDVTSFKVLDDLEPVLEFQTVQTDETSGAKTLDSLSIKIIRENGEVVRTLTAEEIAKGLTLDDTPKAGKFVFELGAALADSDEGEKLAAYTTGGYRLLVNFDARIIPGTTEEELEPYVEETAAKVPNKARYQINDMPEVESNTVTVTPPPISKTVNDVESYDLGGLDEIFTYKIETKLPKDEKNEVTSFTITDTLVAVLEFVETEKLTASIDGVELTKAQIGEQITVGTEEDPQTITWVIDQDTCRANKEKDVVLTFRARIKEGADLSRYIKRQSPAIPNKAKYIVELPDGPSEAESREVTVTPPPIGKLVNDKKHENLKAEDEVFKYTVTVLVPATSAVNPDTGEAERVESFQIKDDLVDELEFADKDKVQIDFLGTSYKGGNKIKQIGTLTWNDGEGVITFDLDPTLITAERSYLELTFYAKIKAGADLSKYEDATGTPLVPNEATYKINDMPEVKSNTVTVTPPDVEKTVNEAEHADLDSLAEVFEYKIGGKVPKTVEDDPETEEVDETVKVTKFKLTDTMEPVLEFADGADTKVLVDGEENADLLSYVSRGTVDPEAEDPQYVLTFELPEDVVNDYADKKIQVIFKAKIKAGVDLTPYISTESGEIEVPNKTTKTIKINDGPEVESESQPVTVTPPPIDKLVNGKDREDLGTPDEIFTYTISTLIPTADKASTFKVKDKLEPVLEYLPTTKKVMIGGEDMTATFTNQVILNKTRNEVTLTLNQAALEAHGGKTVVLEFNARIKNGADLSKYKVDVKDEEGNTVGSETQIPNKARYQIDNKNEVSSEPVVVVPPPVGKTVNGKEHVDLAVPDEEFTYKISTYIPTPRSDEEVKKAEFSDTLESVLVFTKTDEIVVKIDGSEVDVTPEISGQKLSIDMIPLMADNAGKLLTVEFTARINDGTTIEDLADYINDVSEAEIPNEAVVKLQIGDNPEEEMKSKPVTVTPPPIEKKVNGKEHADLNSVQEVFTYEIKTWMPVADKFDMKATSFVIRDVLEPVLEFAEGEVKVTVDGKEVSAEITQETVEIDGVEQSVLTVTFDEATIEANPKKLVVVTFDARIKEDADLTPYETEAGELVPNTASYQINNDPEVFSNEVTVTPPPVDKTVNDDVHADLGELDEVFTYKITGKVPVSTEEEKVTRFELFDVLEPVLEITDAKADVVISPDTLTEENSKLTLGEEDGQAKISLEITDEVTLEKLGGQRVSVTFRAKIKEGANLSAYLEEEEILIPNTAKLKLDINNEPQEAIESKPVTVTPPDENPPIEKKVNGKEHEDLGAADEVFTYTIDTVVPQAAKAFAVTDTLEPVLEFVGKPSGKLAGGATLAADQFAISGQTLTVTLTEAQLAENAGEALTITFDAKIRAGADLSKYVGEEGIKIPNKASYKLTNSKGEQVEKETPPVTVTPPEKPDTPEIEKKINKNDEVSLATGQETFTYTIDSTIPKDAVTYMITDVLEDVLEPYGEMFGTVGDEKIAPEQFAYEGQILTVTLTKEQVAANLGKQVNVTFGARVKEGADVSPYLDDDGTTRIPNTASYTYTNKAGEVITRGSNTVKLTPPKDEKKDPIKPTPTNKGGSKKVKTGDESRVWLWAYTTAFAGMLFVMLLASARRRRRK